MKKEKTSKFSQPVILEPERVNIPFTPEEAKAALNVSANLLDGLIHNLC